MSYIYTTGRTSEMRSNGSCVPERPHASMARRESSRMYGMTRRRAVSPVPRDVTYKLARRQGRSRNLVARRPHLSQSAPSRLGPAGTEPSR